MAALIALAIAAVSLGASLAVLIKISRIQRIERAMRFRQQVRRTLFQPTGLRRPAGNAALGFRTSGAAGRK